MVGFARTVSLCAMTVVLFAAGCGSRESHGSAHPYRGQTVRLGALSGRPTAKEAKEEREPIANLIMPLSAQQSEWAVAQEAQVEVVTQPIARDTAAEGADVLAFRADQLGDLVASRALVTVPDTLILPRSADSGSAEAGPNQEPGQDDHADDTSKPPAADDLAFVDILPIYRDQISRYGPSVISLPVGGSALVLIYRRDALERAENLEAARAAGLKLEVPETYDRLDALVKFFHSRDWNGDGKPEAGIAFAVQPDEEGLAESIFLARAAALGLHPDQFGYLFDDETMKPRIDQAPFVEALAALRSLVALGPEGMVSFDADHARKAFRAGQTVFLIDRAECANQWSDPDQPVAIGAAALPGSERVFDPSLEQWDTPARTNRPSFLTRGGGYLLGVSSKTQGTQRDAAFSFLAYLAGKDAASRLIGNRDFPMLPVRASLLGSGLRSVPGLDSRSWTRAVGSTLQASRFVPPLRIPDTPGYLADLAQARLATIEKNVPANEALEKAAAAWTKRTDQLGHDRQLWFYRHSLNRPTNSPTPP